MNITFIQTCDPLKYGALLRLSSATVMQYCARWNCEYLSYVGIKRGDKPWHASCNRIVLLHELLTQGKTGWAVYLDADAYINDIEFDLRQYLADIPEIAFIAAPAGVEPHVWWHINAGVIAVKLDHPAGREIIERYYEKLVSIPEETLRSETKWGDVIDDQNVLHELLRDNPHLEKYLHQDSINWNYDARFVRQLLRAAFTHEERIRRLRIASQNAEKSDEINERHAFYSELVDAVYRVLLHREPDEEGRNSALSALTAGTITVQDELKSCTESPEFLEKLSIFRTRTRS